MFPRRVIRVWSEIIVAVNRMAKIADSVSNSFNAYQEGHNNRGWIKLCQYMEDVV